MMIEHFQIRKILFLCLNSVVGFSYFRLSFQNILEFKFLEKAIIHVNLVKEFFKVMFLGSNLFVN